MYIIAIAWLYVIFMMSITEKSVVAGVLTFLLYGLLPLTILLWLMGAPQRARNRVKAAEQAAQKAAQEPAAAGSNPQPRPLE